MTKKKTTNFVQVPVPLTPKELKDKFQGKASSSITVPEHAESVGSLSEKEDIWDNPEFTHATITGIFSYEDQVGIDGTGAEHKFPGGVGITFNWAAKGIGFGEFRITKLSDGNIEINAEGLDKEFFRKFMNHLIDTAKVRERKWNTKKPKAN